jgi:CubicO group peptidase (beta-lactamase class C family)
MNTSTIRTVARPYMTNRWLLLVAVLLTKAACAADLPRAKPSQLGFSAERLRYIDEFCEQKVQSGDIAGVVTLVARHGKIAHFSAVGYADLEKKEKMRTDAIFRLYSQTKPVATTALMMLYEQGRFRLTDPISKYLPEFANLRALRSADAAIEDTVPLDRPPTIQDVMRHTAGFSHGGENNAVDAEYLKADIFGLDIPLAEMTSRLSRIPLLDQPGRRFIYSVGPDIQARLVEVLSGMPFDAFLQTRLFEPLGMKDTGYWVPPEKAARLASVYWDKGGKLAVLDAAHSYPADGHFFTKPQFVNSYTVGNKHKGGSYGLVSTAEDYWRFAQMLLNRGELDGTRFLSPQTVRYMTRDHMGDEMPMPPSFPKGLGFGLGFAVVKDAALMGDVIGDGSFFWAGRTLTRFWIDPRADMTILVMTQHLDVPRAIDTVLELRTLVYSALLE